MNNSFSTESPMVILKKSIFSIVYKYIIFVNKNVSYTNTTKIEMCIQKRSTHAGTRSCTQSQHLLRSFLKRSLYPGTPPMKVHGVAHGQHHLPAILPGTEHTEVQSRLKNRSEFA
ncbi:unnamed protein product [Pipistrellus nathusii]|uniref:Uncharacterized protein n=1 Tax=Pipistrellus nathusii TaxID=59473 RepID=A0ABP0A3N3_PIPNA